MALSINRVAIGIQNVMIQNVHEIFDLILITAEALYALIDLLLLYALMRQRQNDFSLYIIKQLWEKDRKNYELQKETVDMGYFLSENPIRRPPQERRVEVGATKGRLKPYTSLSQQRW